jgi:nucleotide-binding universal stress UspA family protein
MDTTIGFMKMNSVRCDPFGRLIDVILQAGTPPAEASAYRLLVPIDGSPASLDALQVAARIADSKTDAVLHLLNAQVVLGGMAHETLLHQGFADTQDARGMLDEAGTPYVLHLVTGNAAAGIVARTREFNIAEIVMGADGAGSIAGQLLGSTAMAVVREAGAPVTLVKSGSGAGRLPAEWFDWLVAFDGSETSQRAVRHVLQQVPASRGGQRVHLLNVQAPSGTLAAYAASSSGLREWAAAECGDALRALDEAGIEHEFHVATGDAVEKILEVADRAGCGHIAMGSRGLGWLESLMLGSVSSGVLRRTAIPVTLVK